MDNEKRVKERTYSGGKERTYSGEKRTDEEAELENKNMITTEVPQRISSRLANELGSHDERCQRRTDQQVQFIDEVVGIPEDSEHHGDSTVAAH